MNLVKFQRELLHPPSGRVVFENFFSLLSYFNEEAHNDAVKSKASHVTHISCQSWLMTFPRPRFDTAFHK